MRKKVLLSWSTGKDSAWALHVLTQDKTVEVCGLFCTVNQVFNRVAMHGVRVELLQQQAQSVGLPLFIIALPHPCDEAQYHEVMSAFVASAKNQGIKYFAFGDLFLKDVREYREQKLKDSGITPLFPLWGVPTHFLSQHMIQQGLQAVITCVDPKQIPPEFCGRDYNDLFLHDLPATADPCGENGEFHSFAFEGPMFQQPIKFIRKEIVCHEGFYFMDLEVG